MTNETHQVRILHADDWAALYVDNEIVHQHHSIPDFVLAQHLSNIGNLDIQVRYDDAFIWYLETHDGFPQMLEDLYTWVDAQ